MVYRITADLNIADILNGSTAQKSRNGAGGGIGEWGSLGLLCRFRSKTILENVVQLILQTVIAIFNPLDDGGGSKHVASGHGYQFIHAIFAY
jgi:hypothetical protein